ncbi:hypothetical protein BN128_2038 [Cronobacter sakazakii 696]|nr:hypothetical protein BN128_2038 [Cronobacter sakazakii 696]
MRLFAEILQDRKPFSTLLLEDIPDQHPERAISGQGSAGG